MRKFFICLIVSILLSIPLSGYGQSKPDQSSITVTVEIEGTVSGEVTKDKIELAENIITERAKQLHFRDQSQGIHVKGVNRNEK